MLGYLSRNEFKWWRNLWRKKLYDTLFLVKILLEQQNHKGAIEFLNSCIRARSDHSYAYELKGF